MIERFLQIFGYKKYTCPNCKKANFFRGKTAWETIAGFCRKCDHPVWYILLLVFIFTSCKTYNIYLVDTPNDKINIEKPVYPMRSNRFSSDFINADSLFNASREASKKAWEQIKQKNH